MSLISEVRVRLHALFSRSRIDGELDEEMRYHLEREAAHLQQQGVEAGEAMRRARAHFGGAEFMKEAARDQRGMRWLDDLWQDTTIGLRSLLRRRLYFAAASITLALGLAATTTIFSLINMILFRPLPIHEPDRMIAIGNAWRSGGKSPSLSYMTVRDIDAMRDVFVGAVAYANETVSYREGGEEPQLRFGHSVTGNYFAVLGITPALGRFFTERDDDAHEQVVVLSHAMWTRRHAGDSSLVGRTVMLNGAAFTVVGIAPEGFEGLDYLVASDFYYPMQVSAAVTGSPATFLTRRGADRLRAFARLQPNKVLADANAALQVLALRIAPERNEKPGDYNFLAQYERLARPVIVVADAIPTIAGTFMALALLALLIACVNVANLVLSRTLARSGEFALRRSLGASQGRLVRQLMTEAALLGVAAFALGAPLAWLVVHWIANLRFAADIPIRIDTRMDWRVTAFAGVTSLLMGAVTGLMPALRGARGGQTDALREGSRGSGTSVGRRRIGSVLLVGQLAFSLVLVIAGALFLRSLQSVTRFDLGVDPTQVVMASVDLSLNRYSPDRAKEYFRRADAVLGALPGVTSVGRLTDAPMGFNQNFRSIEHVDGRLIGETRALGAQANTLTPGAFASLRLRQLEGRAFDQFDDSTAPRRVIVNRELARVMFPGQTRVVGERIRIQGDTIPMEIVGVIQNVKAEFPSESPTPQFFRPYSQSPRLSQAIYVRVAGDPEKTLPAFREALRQLDTEVVLSDVRTMYAFLHEGKAFFLYRLASILATTIGVLGLLQTLVGLYGVIAYGVNQRAQEMGVRLALGATGGQLVRLILAPGAVLIMVGVAVGLVVAALAMPAAANMLSVSPRDPYVYAICATTLACLALLSAWLPARRAAGIAPMIALRRE